jgi:catechol 1,2-dioxygenase
MKAAAATDVATQSAILGPFFREDHPVRQNGDHISFDTPKDAEVSELLQRIETGR